jgi:ATPase subunit of ABC transporter with duplicated ATPase domains
MTTVVNGGHILEVDRVSKYFGRVIALKDISAHVSGGEVVCVLGDNGAGKSTLIKILSGVHRPDDGRYLVDGEDVHFSSPREARGKGPTDVDLAKLLPRRRADERPSALSALRPRVCQAGSPHAPAGDGHRHP